MIKLLCTKCSSDEVFAVYDNKRNFIKFYCEECEYTFSLGGAEWEEKLNARRIKKMD